MKSYISVPKVEHKRLVESIYAKTKGSFIMTKLIMQRDYGVSIKLMTY